MTSIACGRESDLIFVKQARAHLLTDNYLDGPADLAIEIISPESKKRDRKIKFDEYARAGIPEYWLIDPDKQKAEFYLLDRRGHYQLASPDFLAVLRELQVAGLRISLQSFGDNQ